MRTSKLLVIPFILFASVCLSQARELDVGEEDFSLRPLSDRFYTGGNVSFQVANNILLLDVSPIIGYEITENFSSGLGLKYTYIRFNGNPPSSTSIYGPSVFSRYLISTNFLPILNLK